MSTVSSKLVRLASPGRRMSVRKMASLPLANYVVNNLHLPGGVRLEVLNRTHDVSRLRQLLLSVFCETEEPITQALCRYHYPGLVSPAEKLKKIEKLPALFAEDGLAEKVDEGLSFVAVREHDPSDYVMVMFGETYKGNVYECDSDDQFCIDSYDFLHCLHQKVSPILVKFPKERVAFMSHGATSAEYRSTGLLGSALEFALWRLARKGYKVAYMILTTDRHAKFAVSHLGFHMVAEIKYKDYEDSLGRKVMANAPDTSQSAKAMVKFL